MSKVVIELENANKPPKITIDGERVAVVKCEYLYETDTTVYGSNELYIEYVKKDGSDKKDIRIAGFKDPFSNNKGGD